MAQGNRPEIHEASSKPKTEPGKTKTVEVCLDAPSYNPTELSGMQWTTPKLTMVDCSQNSKVVGMRKTRLKATHSDVPCSVSCVQLLGNLERSRKIPTTFLI